ncbi:MAG: hypothetical protein AMXMBFR26_11420 [Porticoccaceae bacterium]
MGLFDIFRRKKAAIYNKRTITIPLSKVDDVINALGRVDSTDYLGQAAEAGSKAGAAVKSGKFDEAWELYHKQKELYMKHAVRSEFTPAQVLALDGSVHEDLANILRLENKHGDALCHFIYSLVTSPKITKSQEKKLPAYVNRAKLKNGTLADVEAFIRDKRSCDFRSVQLRVAAWRPNTKET